MDKVVLTAITVILIVIMFKTKPPFLINTLEAAVLFARDIGLALTYPKYFHNDPKEYQALPFETVLRNMKIELHQKEDTWTLTAEYDREKRPTTIMLIDGYKPDKPTLIYHHGAGSTHPLRDFDFIFGKEFKEKFNVFVVWAQYHTSKQEYLDKSVDSFLHHQETFAGSVLAYEEIIKYHKSHSKQPIIATGSSMGGIVSSLHAFYFGTADYYFPIVAYPNVGEIFLGNAYKYAVADIQMKRKNDSYLTSFVIKDFDQSLIKKVFPIVGTIDNVVPAEKAITFWDSRGFTVTKFPYGHFTPGIERSRIREMLLNKIN